MRMFEIFVPCQTNQGKPIKTRQHKEWDRKVRRITGGLMVLSPTKGQWVVPSDKRFVERMFAVKVEASYSQMEIVADMTAEFYQQEAIMFYELSSDVTIRSYAENKMKEAICLDKL